MTARRPARALAGVRAIARLTMEIWLYSTGRRP